MWMYTKHGIYSIVTTDSGDQMQVRARHRQYLEDLLDACGISHDLVALPFRGYDSASSSP